jgi:hypothetical protein
MTCRVSPLNFPVAESIVPEWGDNVNSGIGWPYRPARLHGLAGRYDKLLPELTLSSSQGSRNSATVDLVYFSNSIIVIQKNIPFHGQ